MELNRKKLKREAKASMSRRRPSVYLVTLVYLLIVLVLQFLSQRLRFPNLSWRELAALYAGDADPEAALGLLTRMFSGSSGMIGSLLYYAIEIMALVMGVGFISFCLLVSRREDAGFGSLFDAFGIFFRALWLSILRALLLMLWALPAVTGATFALLFAPGAGLNGIPFLFLALVLMLAGLVLEVIAAYRYSMCFFILLDAPDKGALQCLRESRELTQGVKGRLFLLDLSFLGWMLLSVIPFVILYTLPYMQVTLANYYRVLSGRPDAPKTIDVSI